MAGATVSRSRDVNAYTFERSDVNMDIVISDLVPDRLVNFLSYAIAEVSSVRDGIEAERNLQGFFMAYFSLNNYYYTAPELELNQIFS